MRVLFILIPIVFAFLFVAAFIVVGVLLVRRKGKPATLKGPQVEVQGRIEFVTRHSVGHSAGAYNVDAHDYLIWVVQDEKSGRRYPILFDRGVGITKPVRFAELGWKDDYSPGKRVRVIGVYGPMKAHYSEQLMQVLDKAGMTGVRSGLAGRWVTAELLLAGSVEQPGEIPVPSTLDEMGDSHIKERIDYLLGRDRDLLHMINSRMEMLTSDDLELNMYEKYLIASNPTRNDIRRFEEVPSTYSPLPNDLAGEYREFREYRNKIQYREGDKFLDPVELEKHIEQSQRLLNAIAETTRCPNCYTGFYSRGSFCSSCGSSFT